MKISQNIYLENFKNKRFDNKIFKLFKDLIKKKNQVIYSLNKSYK